MFHRDSHNDWGHRFFGCIPGRNIARRHVDGGERRKSRFDFSIIGKACNALEVAGWTATIAANRITVDDEVLAQFIPAETGIFGLVNARWVVYSIAGTHPVWIVGGEQLDREDSSMGSSR